MSTSTTCPSCGYHINDPARRPYKLGVLAYQVAQLLMLEKSNAEIALLTSTTEAAVKQHMHRLMNETGTENRTMLALHLHERGIA